MPNLDFYLRLESLLRLAQSQPQIIGFSEEFLSYLCHHAIPHEVVMITLESHFLFNGMCEILFLVSDDHHHLGRREKYDNCVYSKFSNSLGRVVVVEKVDQQPGYLSLDDRVKSETFFECPLNKSVNLILNAEFSTPRISDSVKKWFCHLSRIISKEKNKENIPFSGKTEEES